MCLITRWKSPKIAGEDIICYKFYMKAKDSLLSPYRLAKAPDINTKVNTELDENVKSDLSNQYITIEKGFHSFKSLAPLLNILFNKEVKDYVIFKCIIPRGSKYYEGTFQGNRSYCSNSILLERIIKLAAPKSCY